MSVLKSIVCSHLVDLKTVNQFYSIGIIQDSALEREKFECLMEDKFGKVFSPLSSDVSGNINKIQKSYDTNPKKYTFIEDLVLCEKKENGVAVDALLWLQRALHFLLLFFIGLIRDLEKSESLQKHMRTAYIQVLEPHHGWFSKNLFWFFLNMVPKRSALLSAISEEKKDAEEVIKDLEVYVKSLEMNVNHLISFYKESDL